MDTRLSQKKLLLQYQKLKKSLLSLGLIQQGTIIPRIIPKIISKKNKKPRPYGPYFQWTRKINGKTVTVNLTSSQAKCYGNAIEEYKKLKRILEEMMSLSQTILDSTTKSVIRRKSRKNIS